MKLLILISQPIRKISNSLYFIIQANHSYEDGGRRVAVIMTCYSLLVSIVYLVNKNPIFHEVIYQSILFESMIFHLLIAEMTYYFLYSQFMYGILVITTLVMAIRLNHKQYSKSAALLFYGGMLM